MLCSALCLWMRWCVRPCCCVSVHASVTAMDVSITGASSCRSRLMLVSVPSKPLSCDRASKKRCLLPSTVSRRAACAQIQVDKHALRTMRYIKHCSRLRRISQPVQRAPRIILREMKPDGAQFRTMSELPCMRPRSSKQSRAECQEQVPERCRTCAVQKCDAS